MVVAVAEVVDVVPLERVLAIIQGTSHGSLARACEVGLEGWGACIENGDLVSIVGPHISEDLFKGRWKGLESISIGRTAYFQVMKLSVKHIPAKHGLDYICSIKAIHTVGSQSASLCGLNLDCLLCH